MPRISATNLRPRLAEALRSAEGGEPVVITRHGRPAAALIAADQLPRLEQAPAVEDPPVDAPETGGDTAAEVSTGVAAPSPEELFERAAEPSLRRIEEDLERVPEELRPVLVLVRDNLFQPPLTVQSIRRALGVGAHDLTTRFHAAAGAPIREYFEDRRLECASRLLVDSVLDVETIALLVGYRSGEVFSRAFKRRYGVRPPIYREFGGRLSRDAVKAARPGRAPLAPRYLAGVSAVAPGVPCARCGAGLEPEERLRVFEDSSPICDRCAHERAPDLVARLEAGGAV